jgi:hypothetical protein
MKLPFLCWFSLVFVVGGAGLAMQWWQTTTLRRELELARSEAGELSRLRAENQRLREKEIPPTELEVLRADHAALPRLRAEIEALNKSSPPAGP